MLLFHLDSWAVTPQEPVHMLVLDAQRQIWNAAPYTYIRSEDQQQLQEQQIFSAQDFSPPVAESDMVWLTQQAPGYWLRLQVRSQRPNDHFVLSTKWPNYWDWIGFQSLSFYMLNANANTISEKYQIVRDGRLAEGFSLTTPFALAFELDQGQSRTFFIRLSGQDLPLPLEIETSDRYVQDLRSQEFLYSIYYGIILSLIIFALAMAITLREPRFIWFVVYVLTEVMIFLVSTGVLFLFFRQTNLQLWNTLYFIILGLMGVTTGLLAIKFLDLKIHAPRWHRVIRIYMAASFLSALGCIWIDKQYFYEFCLLFVLILCLGPYIALAACIAVARRTREKNGFYLAAWSLWAAGGTVELLCYAGLIDYSQLTYHMLTLSSALAGLLLMLALADRVNALRRDKEVALATNKAKNIFIAKVSHEMRTPMNAILGFTELVLDSPLSTEQRDQLITVRQCGQHLLDVINDVLDFSKAEARKLRLDPQDFDLHNLVRVTIRGLSVLAAAKNLELHWQLGKDVPQYVRGDQQRLRQILVNLVGNAIKFTDLGLVDLTVEALPHAPDNGLRLRFAITDTGIGIPPQQLPLIFEDYIQAHRQSDPQGTGLGLSICKELVRLMEGDIQVQSEPGKGSTFAFTIVLEPGSPEKSLREQFTPPKIQGAPTIKVLIADDNLINVKVAVAHLSRLGYATAAVGNGEEVLQTLACANFDIVLMDLEMPRLNGVETIKCIRSGQGNVRNPGIPIIVLTAFSLSDAQEQCQGIDVDGFMLKPVSFHELAARINKCIYADSEDKPQSAANALTAGQTEDQGLPLLDSETARLRLDLDEESYQSIFKLSLGELKNLRDRLLACENGPLCDSLNAVHTLKSTAATIGAVALQQAAMDLEQLLRGRRNGNPDKARKHLFRTLDALFDTYGIPDTTTP